MSDMQRRVQEGKLPPETLKKLENSRREASRCYRNKDKRRLDNAMKRAEYQNASEPPTSIVFFMDCTTGKEGCFKNPNAKPHGADRTDACLRNHLELGSGDPKGMRVHCSSVGHATTTMSRGVFFRPDLLHRTIRPAQGHRYSLQIAVDVGKTARGYVEGGFPEKHWNQYPRNWEWYSIVECLTNEPKDLEVSIQRHGLVHDLILTALAETADAFVSKRNRKGINSFAHATEYAFWNAPRGRFRSPEEFREAFYEAAKQERLSLYSVWEALGVACIAEMRILLVDATASAFVIHKDIGHVGGISASGRVFHMNIAYSEDYLPGTKSRSLSEDRSLISSTPSKFDEVIAGVYERLTINYISGQDRIAIHYGKKVCADTNTCMINAALQTWKFGSKDSDKALFVHEMG